MSSVVVATATNILVATAWRDLLRSAGIPAELTGTNFESLYPMQAGLARIDVLVNERDAAEARRLIDEMERAVPAEDQGPEETTRGDDQASGNGSGRSGDAGASRDH